MPYGRSYPFWEKNRADRSSSEAMWARNETNAERSKKEEYQKQLENVEKVIRELKILIEKQQTQIEQQEKTIYSLMDIVGADNPEKEIRVKE